MAQVGLPSSPFETRAQSPLAQANYQLWIEHARAEIDPDHFLGAVVPERERVAASGALEMDGPVAAAVEVADRLVTTGGDASRFARIGAGKDCDGQVLVSTDLLGMSQGHAPKFVKHFAEIGDAIVTLLFQSGAFTHRDALYVWATVAVALAGNTTPFSNANFTAA